MYSILPYTKARAKELGVEIKPSKKKNKKIDVYTDQGVISIGDKRYKDYPTYKKFDGADVAEFHRRLYHARHKKDTGLAGFYAKQLLW
jgi:hypothetical protein